MPKGQTFHQHNLRAALKNGVAKGLLTQDKQSYKLAPAAKKAPKKKKVRPPRTTQT